MSKVKVTRVSKDEMEKFQNKLFTSLSNIFSSGPGSSVKWAEDAAWIFERKEKILASKIADHEINLADWGLTVKGKIPMISEYRKISEVITAVSDCFERYNESVSALSKFYSRPTIVKLEDNFDLPIGKEVEIEHVD